MDDRISSLTKHPRISQDPAVMYGKPVVRGTRIPVEHVLRLLGEGMPEAELLRQYPALVAEDVLAVQLFAADFLANSDVLVV
ncbi:MAG: DUF433 domain-containing protein [Alphaproteobacteria bacterium]|nr:DUF433 domain-containing protein [Alphaproteobacteria bacterium]